MLACECDARGRLGLEETPYLPRVQLAAAFDALIKNALEFSPPEAPVEVSVTTAGAVLTVAVEDRGISPWQPSPHGVHDPFYTTKHRDLGLGLAVAHAVAAHHDGKLEVAPRPGGGTRVTLALAVGASAGKPVDDSTVRPLP